MAAVSINGSAIGTPFNQLLTTNDAIEPGGAPGYQLCKLIYTFHPLGAKLAEKPIDLAQSQRREISVNNSPEERVVEAFNAEWDALNCDRLIKRCMRLARVYGIASVACMTQDEKTDVPLDFMKLYKQKLSFNVYDPLNTAGSLVLNQDPLAIDFQHTTDIRVGGATFHRSRSCIVMNEDPIYIEYTDSAFGFVGRSVYQRALYPLKSFVRSMITDDMIEVKVGVIVAKIKQVGSAINNAMMKLLGTKRAVVKEAETGNVINTGHEDSIESLNLQNMEAPHKLARHNILENIASAAGMPAKLMTEETLAEGFGEGTEDAKAIARYIDGVRKDMQPLYDYFDKIVRHRAWNPEFYKTIQKDFPEYKDVDYNTAFYQWTNDFRAQWPNLLKEPDSELVKVDEVKLTAMIALTQTLLPELDPENKVLMIEALLDNVNAMKFLFDDPFELDFKTLLDYLEENKNKLEDQLGNEPLPPKRQEVEGAADAVAVFKGKVSDFVKRRQGEKK